MKQVVFLYNEWLDEEKQKLAKLPLEFICFAYIDNTVMYEIEKKYVAIREGEIAITKKYNKVYGALYILHNSERSIRTLDAVMICSKAFIGSNHKNDVTHRKNVQVTPIHFNSIEEFLLMCYKEKDKIDAITYLANQDNIMIREGVLNTVRNREVCGFDINNFINLMMKEKDENEK